MANQGDMDVILSTTKLYINHPVPVSALLFALLYTLLSRISLRD
jgi:hypothetical protein